MIEKKTCIVDKEDLKLLKRPMYILTGWKNET